MTDKTKPLTMAQFENNTAKEWASGAYHEEIRATVAALEEAQRERDEARGDYDRVCDKRHEEMLERGEWLKKAHAERDAALARVKELETSLSALDDLRVKEKDDLRERVAGLETHVVGLKNHAMNVAAEKAKVAQRLAETHPHFVALRARAEKAEARVAELEAALQCHDMAVAVIGYTQPKPGLYLSPKDAQKVRETIEEVLTSGASIVGDGRLADDVRADLYVALALLEPKE